MVALPRQNGINLNLISNNNNDFPVVMLERSGNSRTKLIAGSISILNGNMNYFQVTFLSRGGGRLKLE